MKQQLLRKNFLGFLIAITVYLCAVEKVYAQSKLWGMTTKGGIQSGTIFSIGLGGNSITDQYNFSCTAPGASPQGDLIQAADGKLYGMTYAGGVHDGGVIFQYDPMTNAYTKKIELDTATGYSPSGSLLQANDGKLYGMTFKGGNNNFGTIFQYDPLTSIYTKKIDMPNSPVGSLIQATDGKLYGHLFGGTIFQYDPLTNTVVTKANAPGSINGSLVQASDGKLYGMTFNGGTNGNGTIFQYDPVANLCVKKIDLSTTLGGSPQGSLIQASDGKLYGMTYYGGNSNIGVLFQYDPVGNIYTKKVDFNGPFTGVNPNGSLLQASDGKLYGMTTAGGSASAGNIFSYDPVANSFTNKIYFSLLTGGDPLGSLVQATDGKLYGMTSRGGANGFGVIFQYDRVANSYSKTIDFATSPNGAIPLGSLVQAIDGKFYGMTSSGGPNSAGVIFQYDPITNIYTRKIDFSSANGASPYGSLVPANDSCLYGMTFSGGLNNAGVIFKYNPMTNSYSKKIDLASASGSNPYGSLLLANDGKLYGMTYAGGANNTGVIFQYDPVANVYIKKIDLAVTTGNYAKGSLIQASDGKLYGMTYYGGAFYDGVIFQYDPVANIYTKKFDFNGPNGWAPYGSLLQALDGKLYGMAFGNANSSFVIFQYDPVTNIYTKKIELATANGFNSLGSLMQASDGKLYGMTNEGGSNGIGGIGVIFKYDPVTNTYTKMLDFNYINGASPEYTNLIEAYAALNMKMYIHGYYIGNGRMNAALYSSSVSSNLNEVDTVQVSLVDSVTHSIVQVAKGRLQTNGMLIVNFPLSIIGNKYYLKINHRNAIETWSKYTVLMSSTATYDFTTGATQAYGSNMVRVDSIAGKPVYALWNGDVYDGINNKNYAQDGVIENADYLLEQNDFTTVLFGYYATDLTGDGVVENADYLLEQNNFTIVIFKATPW